MMTPAPLHVSATVAPAPLLPVAVLALVTTALKPAVKTATLLDPVALGIFLSPALFVNCRVKCHEDVPRHIWGLFKALCIQCRWILTRCALARELVTTADLAINNAKETAWMALHEHEHEDQQGTDTLCPRADLDQQGTDTLCPRADLWSEFSNSISVFDANTTAQQLCALKVWEALLADFPLNHKHMQTVLLAREMASMMKWDGDSKHAVNIHFGKVNETRRGSFGLPRRPHP
jgi:hypothetical protein